MIQKTDPAAAETARTTDSPAVVQERLALPLPSWFAEKGIPCCSKWGKTEIEYLAWAYAAAQARDGDTWHEITPEKAYGLLTEEEHRIVGGFTREGTLHHAYLEWWKIIGRQLRDADGAFEVGGLSWTRWKFDRERHSESSQNDL